MPRDYGDEEFIPWYVRDTPGWLRLSLAARGAVSDIVRKLDKRGRLPLGELADLAVLLRLRWEGELEPAVAELLAVGRFIWDAETSALVDPQYHDRQRRTSSDRVRDHRDRKRRVTDETPCNGGNVPSPLLSSDLNLGEVQEGGPPTAAADPPPAATPDELAEAYADGQREASGAPFPPPDTPWDRAALERFGREPGWGAGLAGPALAAAVHTWSQAFRRACDDQPSKHRGFSPEGCEAWARGAGWRMPGPAVRRPPARASPPPPLEREAAVDASRALLHVVR